MKTLADSAIFNQMVSRPDLLNSMKLVNLSLDKVSETTIQNELNTINRRMNYGTKSKALDYLAKEKIVLINKEGLKIPKFLSIFGLKNNNNLHIAVNISPFKTKNEIYPKTLFALLQNALISYELATNWNSYVNNIELIKNSCISYSRLMAKIFDKIFALDLDRTKSDFMSFVFAKFFLINICDKNDSDTINALALKACFNKTSERILIGMESDYEIIYQDIFSLFKILERIEGFNHLNIRSFIENYVRMFGENSILSLDYLPAFFHMIMSSIIAGGLVKDNMIENVAGKFNSKIYTSIVKLL